MTPTLLVAGVLIQQLQGPPIFATHDASCPTLNEDLGWIPGGELVPPPHDARSAALGSAWWIAEAPGHSLAGVGPVQAPAGRAAVDPTSVHSIGRSAAVRVPDDAQPGDVYRLTTQQISLETSSEATITVELLVVEEPSTPPSTPEPFAIVEATVAMGELSADCGGECIDEGNDCTDGPGGMEVPMAVTLSLSGGPVVLSVADSLMFTDDHRSNVRFYDADSMLVDPAATDTLNLVAGIGCVGLAPSLHIVAWDPHTLEVVASQTIEGDPLPRPPGTEELPTCDGVFGACGCDASTHTAPGSTGAAAATLALCFALLLRRR